MIRVIFPIYDLEPVYIIYKLFCIPDRMMNLEDGI